MPEVTLKGHVVTLDDCDAHLLQKPWTLSIKRDGRLRYVGRSQRIEGKKRWVLLHREILQPEVGQIVDHIDGNGLNNSRSNLRICTTKQNLRNQKKKRGNSASKFKGVYRHRFHATWGGQIRVDYKKYQKEYAGQTQLQAAIWYDEMAVKHFGEFAKLNFPERRSLILSRIGGDLV